MQFSICMPLALPQEDGVKRVPKQGVHRDRFAWTWSRVGTGQFLAETALNCCKIYSAVSTVLGGQSLVLRKILERALWIRRFVLNRRGFGGQLRYGDSICRSYLCFDWSGSVVTAMCNMQFVLPKNLPCFCPTRGAAGTS